MEIVVLKLPPKQLCQACEKCLVFFTIFSLWDVVVCSVLRETLFHSVLEKGCNWTKCGNSAEL